MDIESDTIISTGERNSDKGRRGRAYGWIVAVAGGLIVLTVQNFQYTFGVFLKPLIDQFGWSRTAISGCVTVRSVIVAILSPVSGALSDRYGPRRWLFVGIIVIGASYLLASRISSIRSLYLILGLSTGIGSGFILTPLIATVTRWFGGKAGLANGIVMSGFGVSQVLLPPIATYLILGYGWGTCFIVLGMIALGAGSGALYFIKNPPRRLNTPQETRHGIGAVGETRATGEYSASEAFHAPAFWILFIIFMTVAICYQMVVIHVVAAAMDEGATFEAAAIILSLSGVTNTLGRLTVGGLANRFGVKLVMALCLILQVPAIFYLAWADDVRLFYILCTVFSFAYSGTTPIIPTMAASLFGTRSVGSIYGILNLGYTVGVAIGPLLAGYIFDMTGSYAGAFLSAAGALFLSFLLCLMIKVPQETSETNDTH